MSVAQFFKKSSLDTINKHMDNREQMKKWIAISEQQQLDESFLGFFRAMGTSTMAMGNAFFQLMKFIVPVAYSSGKNLGKIIDDVTQLVFEYYGKEDEPKVDGMTATPPSPETGLTKKPPMKTRLMAYLRQAGIDFDQDMEDMADQMDKVYNSTILRDPMKQQVFKNFVFETLPEIKDKMVRFLKAMVGPKLKTMDGPAGDDKESGMIQK